MPQVGALRVLIVEDELLIRWSIAEMLTAAGHTVVEATDAASARRVVADSSEHVHVVLLDFRLPDSHDLTLLADIRRLAPEAAIVMMTAFGTPDVRASALTLGAHEVIDKPFDMTSVEPLVRQAYLAGSA